ncbi:Glucose-6-phosphate isomerase [Weeksella virosa]|uniref:glucose-6-phosphate isomerase n=1 Tax=Weeksella virosa TaxID=1014 RepID=UPI000E035FF2|nr:glucose-6-phosphate isomerase [Weeksella virosa]SUP53857.1 Glucose-6-phosphate isomerase [Weeksella virosa]
MTLPKINPQKTNSWARLMEHFYEMKGITLANLFTLDKYRYQKFSIETENILFDYSKNILTQETIDLLLQLSDECKLKEAIKQQFKGEKINETENRAVLHTALRNPNQKGLKVDEEEITPKINKVLGQMKSFSQKVISGEWKGYTNLPITDVVNIGIGGSDLGPHMVVEALKAYSNHLKIHFVSNVDASHLQETVRLLNPETTLFIIVSKTFTTQETMTNATSAKYWFLENGGTEQTIAQHFVAVSANEKAVEDFGIDPQQMFVFWDWVGGRYSLWSAVGLSICLAVGYDYFEELLSGAQQMDEHFLIKDFKENIPVLMALIGIWYTNFFDAETYAIFPYDQYLHLFVPFLQQLDMESNGKSIDRNGKKVSYQTGPVIWGEPGTNGQHAFYQLLHQGTKFIPADFLIAAQPVHSIGDHHQKLMANFLAQTEALAFGKDKEAVIKKMNQQQFPAEEIQQLVAHRCFEGNHPTNSILYKKLEPRILGELIAMYEHKVFVQGIIWNVFSFDQWGVELGKEMTKKILPELISNQQTTNHDSSTNGLISQYKKWQICE